MKVFIFTRRGGEEFKTILTDNLEEKKSGCQKYYYCEEKTLSTKVYICNGACFNNKTLEAFDTEKIKGFVLDTKDNGDECAIILHVADNLLPGIRSSLSGSSICCKIFLRYTENDSMWRSIHSDDICLSVKTIIDNQYILIKIAKLILWRFYLLSCLVAEKLTTSDNPTCLKNFKNNLLHGFKKLLNELSPLNGELKFPRGIDEYDDEFIKKLNSKISAIINSHNLNDDEIINAVNSQFNADQDKNKQLSIYKQQVLGENNNSFFIADFDVDAPLKLANNILKSRWCNGEKLKPILYLKTDYNEDFNLCPWRDRLTKLIEDLKIGIVVDITDGSKDTKDKEAMKAALLEKSFPHNKKEAVLAVLKDYIAFRDDVGDFSQYYFHNQKYLERILHRADPAEKTLDKGKEKILKFEEEFSSIFIPADISLNILIVENNPGDITSELNELKGKFAEINFFLVRKDFQKFREFFIAGTKEELSNFIATEEECPFKTSDPITFDQIDLILQDIYLEDGGISGAELAELYFDVAPQALVFFLTNMDVETLAASSLSQKVDRIIAKNRIPGLLKYYYERFDELYGPLLWSVFRGAQERGKGSAAVIGDRTSVRHLLANIRSWTLEPGILFHGFALPEMVDHAFRHTSGLWRMANKILGPIIKRYPQTIIPEDIMLLSLAIWLHDIGHRGDKFHSHPMDIRDHHGSLSEGIILEYHEALGLKWLRDFCVKNEGSACDGLKNRNLVGDCNNGNDICFMRSLGLICRYHQSSAPLDRFSLRRLLMKGKHLSPYCRYGLDEEHDMGVQEITDGYHVQINKCLDEEKVCVQEKTDKYQGQIDTWLDDTQDFGWHAAGVRILSDFVKETLLPATGMLRWLDALHTHQEKVGSALQVKSFIAYLEMRREYCEKQVKKIKRLLDKSQSGSEDFMNLLSELSRINNYKHLLDVQDIHLWRSAFVKDIYGGWYWKEKTEEADEKCWVFRIVFEVFENGATVIGIDDQEMIICNLSKKYPDVKPEDSLHMYKLWAKHVYEKVIKDEEGSQEPNGKKDEALYFKQIFDKDITIDYYYKIENKIEFHPINQE